MSDIEEPLAHPDDRAVDLFAAEMKRKLAAARAKGRSGWDTADCTQNHLSRGLREHVEKGDPLDVANFCAFLWNRGESIAASPQGSRLKECAERLVQHADFQLGGVLSAESKSRDIPSQAVSSVKARHLAALRDALSALTKPAT